MMIAGIDTFTAVTAILSFSPRSFSDFSVGERVLRYIGIAVIAAMPFTLMLALVLSHSVRNAGGPAAEMCAAPDSSMSLTTEGPPKLTQLTLRFGSPFSCAACHAEYAHRIVNLLDGSIVTESIRQV